MTEAEWLRAYNPDSLLSELCYLPALNGAVGQRKFRLLAVANCRTVEEYYRDDPESVARVRLAEEVADGHLSAEGLPQDESFVRDSGDDTHNYARHVTRLAILSDAFSAARQSCYCVKWSQTKVSPRDFDEAQVRLIRDIFGNPFYAIAFDPAWRTSDVLALAKGIYDDRAFDGMPILADALQEAGCNDPLVLAHCRNTGISHARGCWVVDGVLEKA